MKVKITADGTSSGTRVKNAAGETIEGVTKVAFSHNAGGAPTIVAEIAMIEADLDGKLVVYGPNGKKVVKIVYEDGSVSEYF